MPISGSRGSGEVGEPQVDGHLETNNLGKSKPLNALCAALMVPKMTGDEREARMMLESHYLFQPYGYSMKTAVGAKMVWTTSVAIFDSGAGTILI